MMDNVFKLNTGQAKNPLNFINRKFTRAATISAEDSQCGLKAWITASEMANSKACWKCGLYHEV